MSSNAKADLAKFFSTNRQWAEKVNATEPTFFKETAKTQTPKILWLGCADSRVPESVLMAVKPGEVFVHRNIANQFHLNDDSALSVLTYAVENLGVEHVVVCGHTQCGGVKGAYSFAQEPSAAAAIANTPLGRWLTPLIKIADSKQIPEMGEEIGIPQLTIESVKKQVANIISTNIIRNAWKKGKNITVHGWVYHLESGKLEDLDIDVEPPRAA